MNLEANSPSIFTKICKIFSKYNFFKSLSSKLENPQLVLASKHLFNKYFLFSQEIYGTASIIFLLSMIFSTLLFISTKSLLILIVGFIIGYFIYNYIVNKLLIEYENEKFVILKYVEITFQEFLIILSTTQSIFDSILFISQGNYPFISKKFRNLIWKINLGANPESALYNFAINQPSVPLKERILSILATNFSQDMIIEELERNLIEKETEYQKFTKELDSKLILLLGFCTFIPLLLLIAIILNGWVNNYWIFLFPIIYLLLINIAKRKLIKSTFFIFGSYDSENYGGNKTNIKHIRSEFEELLKFLSFFGNFLKRGYSVEQALINSINRYEGILKMKLKNLVNDILLENSSFSAALDKFSQNCLNFQSIQIINLIKRMLEKDSIKSGNQIISLITNLKKNQNLIKKRELVYESQQFKVQIISMISSFVLGLLASLSPIFSLAINFSNFGQKFQGIFLKMINLIEYIPLFITLISILIISSYYMAKSIQLNSPIKNIFISLFIFGVVWYVSYSYLFNSL